MSEVSRDAVALLDAEGRIVAWNRAAERAFGHARRDALGRSLVELLACAESLDEAFSRVRVAGDEAGLEIEAARADGATIPVELTLTPLHGEEGLTTCALLRDLSGSRRAEEALARTEARFHRLVETLPGMVYEFVLRPDGEDGFRVRLPRVRVTSTGAPSGISSPRDFDVSRDDRAAEDREGFAPVGRRLRRRA